jgi:hypothetical protein
MTSKTGRFTLFAAHCSTRLPALSLALGLALGLALSAAVLGCGSGLSTEDAQLRCDQERAAKDQCFTDEAYAQCVSCYEECGDSCATLTSCPVQYSCASD